MLAGATTLALGALPLAGQGVGSALSAPISCAVPFVIDPASLPYSGPGIDTRSMALDPAVPTFPCYGKLVLPSGGQVQPSKVVWFSFTPAATDTYRIDTLGSSPSDYDTILGVYTGGCAALAPVSGVCGKSGFFPDDAPGSLQSSVTLNLAAGTTYTIAVGAIGAPDGYTGEIDMPAGGTLKLGVARVPVAYAYTYLVPSLVHSGGFVSDLYVTNLENADGQFLAQYLTHGNDGEQTVPARQPQPAPQIVLANGTRLYADVIGLLGYADDWGALVLQSNRRLAVGARTWALAEGVGTIGQYSAGVEVSPGLAAPEALATGETGRFVGVREDAGMRTNLLFANTAAVACTLQAEVRDGSGAVLGAARSFTVPPSTAMQKNRLRDTFGIPGDVRNASVVVRNVTAGCSVVGVAYVIDGNVKAGSNDPYAVPLRK
ncbi:MAG: hypothetical protein WCC53_13825 [Thermoanaerobaculia bacterium]